MASVWLALAIFAATFAFAFLVAAVAPLVLAAQNVGDDGAGRKLGFLQLGKLLLLLGCIPVFWFVLLLVDAPEKYAAVRRCWSENRSTRVMFWVACSLAVVAVIGFQFARQ